LDTEDTLLEASVDPVYDTESIEFSESSVRDVDEESAGYKSATSSAFDLEETVDRVEPTEVADEVETVAAADPFEFAQHPESGAVATSPTAGYTPGPVPKRSSFVGNLLKGALTALLVLTLTQLVAWWGFGSDPLGVATKLPAALQIVVPEKLVAKTPVLRNRPRPVQPIADADADSDADESDADAQDSGSVDNVGSGSNSVDVAAGEATSPADIPEEDIPEEDVAGVGTPTGNETPDLSGGFSVADNGASEPGIATPAGDDMAGLLGDSDAGAFNPDDENAGMSDLPGEGSESRPSDPDAVALDSSVTDEASGDDEDFGALLDMDDSDDSDAGTALGAVEPPVVEKSIFTDMGPRNARQVSRNDVAATIAAAEKAFNAFESARLLDSKDFGAVAKQFYISHCELAENATVVPRDGSEDILVGSRKLIERLQADESKHAFIANCARGWLSRGNNPTPGVVLAGTVDKISRAGELNRLTVKLMDVRKGKELNTPVTVVTRLDANEGRVAYGQGAKVIVFGTRVDNPAVNLPGYQGRDGVVVYVTDQFVTIP
jgi:hypothetical protein